MCFLNLFVKLLPHSIEGKEKNSVSIILFILKSLMSGPAWVAGPPRVHERGALGA